MLGPKVCHLFRTGRPANFKLGTQMEHEDPYDRQGQRSNTPYAMSRGASSRCWPISRECKVPETPKLVGRLTIQRSVMRTSLKVRGQGHQSVNTRDLLCVSAVTAHVSALQIIRILSVRDLYTLILVTAVISDNKFKSMCH